MRVMGSGWVAEWLGTAGWGGALVRRRPGQRCVPAVLDQRTRVSRPWLVYSSRGGINGIPGVTNGRRGLTGASPPQSAGR